MHEIGSVCPPTYTQRGARVPSEISHARGEKTGSAHERKKRTTWDNSRFSLGKQMDRDRANRERIEALKAQEKASETAELERWQNATDASGGPRSGGTKVASSGASPMMYITDEVPPPLAVTSHLIFDETILDAVGDDTDKDEDEVGTPGFDFGDMDISAPDTSVVRCCCLGGGS